MTGRIPLRLRIALAFVVASALALGGLGAFLVVRVEHTLEDQVRASLASQLEALAGLPAAGRTSAVERLSGATFGQLLGTDGTLTATSPQINRPLIDPAAVGSPADGERALRVDVRVIGDDEAEPAVLLLRATEEGVLVVGTSLEPVEEAMDGILAALLVGVPLALLLAAGAGYLVAGYALRPIETMRRRATTISALDPGERLPLPAADDEVRRLALTLNEMLDRLEAAVVRERDFVAEASHELRTPLAVLRTELDLALDRPRDAEELRAALRSAGVEVDRLTRLSRDLLELAASEGGRRELDRRPHQVSELLESVAARFATSAAELGRRIVVETDETLEVEGDAERLERALDNLIDNALRHGAGTVRLAAVRVADRVDISVADTGAGVDRDFRERAFDRFSRAPGARSAGEGSGLGLAIVRAIAREHGGEVRIDEPAAGSGTVVRLELPAR